MIIPHININNSSKYKPDLSHVSGFTRKINLTYLPWKPKLPKYTSSSTAYSTKLSTERKILSFAKPQFWERHQMNKIVIQFVCFFHSGVKKNFIFKPRKCSLVILDKRNALRTFEWAWLIWNCSKKYLWYIQKLFLVFSYQVKIKSTILHRPQNDNNEVIYLVRWLKN